jgi:putative membrane protein
MKTLKCILAVILVSGVTSFTIPAQAQSAQREMMKTQEFVQKVAISNQFEIMSSQLALQNTNTGSVRQFAEQMITDHTRAGSDFKQALAESELDGAPPATLDEAHQETMTELQGLSGASFDNQYIKAQMIAHDEAVLLFRTYAENGENKALQQFAAATLPTLERHQAHVMQLQGTQ